MASSRDKLTTLQRELLERFFSHEQRMFLTGGAALAGFYLRHRRTEDLDLFTVPGLELAEAAQVLGQAAHECGAETRALQRYPDFQRLLVTRGGGAESCVVDLVVDRAPQIDVEKATFGAIRIDTVREIAANKLCTLMARSEIKDLVDFEALVRGAGVDVHHALEDAQRKDSSVDPATLAWVLEQVRISPEARLPGETDPASLELFRVELVKELRSEAFRNVRQ